jgi:hypothetical protein
MAVYLHKGGNRQIMVAAFFVAYTPIFRIAGMGNNIMSLQQLRQADGPDAGQTGAR